MILAADVQYGDTGAQAAGVLFTDWPDAAPERTLLVHLPEVAEYVPGEFYRRELPCLLRLVEVVAVPLSAVVVDGYVTLGEDARPGLGWKLWEALGRAVPVVGVAKTAFAGTPAETEVRRGGSHSPLYVTAAGLPLADAKAQVAAMHGPHRLPTLLNQADRLARGLEAASTFGLTTAGQAGK
ncbi:endonuclease V [Deinococcus sp. PESE-13]